MRVLVVDDSAFMRRSLSRMIDSEPGLEVVDTARDGEEAVEKVKRLKPDVVTLDIEMPKMNGIEALKEIMRQCPTPVLMCSSLTKEGSHETLEAMRLGALDFITKDASHVSIHIDDIHNDLVAKIKAIGAHAHSKKVAQAALAKSMQSSNASPKSIKVTSAMPAVKPGQYDLILIGSSTGGPPILESILMKLPPNLSVPVVVAQHMPRLFSKSMAERFDAKCAVTVVFGEVGMPLHPATVYIAPGGKQAHALRSASGRWALDINDEPADALYKPSVDVLFASAAEKGGARCLAAVLTGMGDDGSRGAVSINEKGGLVLAQDAASCAVYGMPKAAVESGAVKASLTPDQIAQTLVKLAENEPLRRAS